MRLDPHDIERLLSRQQEVTAWEMTRIRDVVHQDYRIMGQPECQRHVERERLQLHLYLERERNGRRVLGESKLVLDSDADLFQRIRDSVERARFTENPPFSLPGPESSYEAVEIFDSGLQADPLRITEQLCNEIEEAARKEGVVVASSEVEIGRRRIGFRNSLGLAASYRQTELFLDLVLLARGEGGEEAESHLCRRVRRRQDLDATDLTVRHARFARDTLHARQPPTGRFDVVFSNECLDTLFDYFVAQSGGPAAHEGWSRFQPGEPVVNNPEGESFSLTSDPHLAGGLLSRPFDEHGGPTKPVEVIRNGIFRNRPVDCRYAGYLGLPPTGPFANLNVEAGRRPLRELLAPLPVLHCIRFSTFEPHPVSGAFSGEIRIAYWIDESGVHPVKGGSVSGRMDEAFRNAAFSLERVRRGSYCGPAGVKLCNLAVAGA